VVFSGSATSAGGMAIYWMRISGTLEQPLCFSFT